MKEYQEFTFSVFRGNWGGFGRNHQKSLRLLGPGVAQSVSSGIFTYLEALKVYFLKCIWAETGHSSHRTPLGAS